MSNNTNINLSALSAPAIRSLKWAANSSITALEGPSKGHQRPFRGVEVKKCKAGSNAEKAYEAFNRLLSEQGHKPCEVLAPASILQSFGVTDMSVASLKGVVEQCKQALLARRDAAKAEREAKAPPSAPVVPFVSDAPKAPEAPEAPKASEPKAPEKERPFRAFERSGPAAAQAAAETKAPAVVTKCSHCGEENIQATAGRPRCPACGKVADPSLRSKPGRKASPASPAEPMRKPRMTIFGV